MAEEYSNYNEGEEGRTKSKYNSAIAQLYRLDNLWRDTHNHSRSGNLKQWNWDLDRVWQELAGDLKINNVKDKVVEVNYQKINKRLAELDSKLKHKQLTLNNFSEQLYQLLNEKELFLRRMQNDLGKGTAFEDEMEDEWD